jgi:hypothetical protein
MEEREERLQEWWAGFYRGDSFDPENKLTSLASQYRDDQPCTSGKISFGSFHVCVRVEFEDGLDWIVRLPLPYRLLEPNTHTEKEVTILHFLRQKTQIPVPEVIGYGYGASACPKLGPYIITKYVHGIPLEDWFKDRRYSHDHPDAPPRLRIDIGDDIIRKVYRQAAAIILELFSLKFSSIGTLRRSRDTYDTLQMDSPSWTKTIHEAQRNHNVQFNSMFLHLLLKVAHNRSYTWPHS